MKKNHTILITLLSATVLMLAGCGTTSSFNTNAAVVPTNVNSNVTNTNAAAVDTSDWKTYTNDEYGFSFEYKSSWSVDWNGIDQCWYIKDKDATVSTNPGTYPATICKAGYFDQTKYNSLSDWQSHRGASGLQHDEETSAQTLNGKDVLFVHSPGSILDHYLILDKNSDGVLSLTSAQWSDTSLVHLLNSFTVSK